MFGEIQIPSLPLLTTSLVVLVVILLLNRFWKKSDDASLRLPPGPWKLPLIGNLHQLAFAAGTSPHHFLADLAKKHGIASSPCNEYWREMRKVCVLELLSAKRVRSFASLREEETSNLVQSITSQSSISGAPINLSEMIFSTVASITARAALGKRCKHQQEFISLAHQILKLSSSLSVPDLFPSFHFLHHVTGIKSAVEKMHTNMDRILVGIINDHKQLVHERPGGDQEDDHEDLVDVLLHLQDSDKLPFQLTANHVKAVILDMYIAGSETSATTIEWVMSELLRNPKAMEKAQSEVRQLVAGKSKISEADIKKLDCLKLVIKETLRLHPPGAILPRQATESCKVSGYDVPSGARVLVNAWVMGRDPKLWGPNADCFEPERFQGSSVDFYGSDLEFIPFGAGKRMCPGIAFATGVIEIALCQLLYFFNWKLPNGTDPQELDMTEAPGLNTKKKIGLKVIAIPFSAK